MMILPVILAGGSGTRLWPLSRDNYPKQFLQVSEDGSLLVQTLQRLTDVGDCLPPFLVTKDDHRFIVADTLRKQGVTKPTIILEPAGRNTAPAVAAAAHEAIRQHGPETLMLVMPSDHVIASPVAFAGAVHKGASAARQGRLVTFGVVPASPETGYGYIRAGDSIGDGVFTVVQFVEKPDIATARQYLQAGCYYWNSGIFLFQAGQYLEQLNIHAADIAQSVTRAHAAAQRDADFIRLDKTEFSACRSDSIDYAVMEKTRTAAVTPLDAGWNDLGSWNSFSAIRECDSNGNVCTGDVVAQSTRNCFIYSDGRLVTTIGIQDQIVVETADAVLVANKDNAQDVKQLVEQMRKAGRPEASEHRKVYRPWGSYEDIVKGPRFRVKHIVVNPGGRLSLQMHHHRAEHWVIVCGTASVTRGEDQMLLTEDQSTYIPLGVKHRLENTTELPLELIEVQTGAYVGEDDIVRFEDVYGRSQKG